MKLQLIAEDGSVALCDGFIRAEPFLERQATPFSVKLKDFCFVPAEEFSKDVSVESLSPVSNKGFLILWQWNDIDCEDESISNDLSNTTSLSTDSDFDREDYADNILSTATFKCIGVTRDSAYQVTLKAISKHIEEGIDVPVKLEPEPTNQFDSRAITFQCQLNGSWKIIGYIAKELCDCIHDSITKQSIVVTKLAWVKYKVVRTTGPGYYAAIDITRKGEWPPIVHRSASTMH